MLDSTETASAQQRASPHVSARSKRKSNAYLAAEAVQQERDAIKALKRLSMGGSLSMDPDLTAEYEFQDYQKKQQRRKRSASTGSLSSASSLDDEADKTLIDDDVPHDNDNARLDTEKLLWVPAKSHPGIAPDQFKRHVQSTLDDMSKKLNKSREPIPSLRELTDELDKLTEMAGLAATDAVSLARSLSSASSSSSMLYGEHSSSTDEGRVTEEEVDQDAPMFADSSSSLKRNKWTTYTRRNRVDRSASRREEPSPFLQKELPRSPSEKESPSGPEKALRRGQRLTEPEPIQYHHHHQQQQQGQQQQQHQHQPQRGQQEQHEQHEPHPYEQLQSSPTERSYRSVSDHKVREDPAALQRSQSDMAAKRTNHSRNRHAGSMISVDEDEKVPIVQAHPAQAQSQRRKVSPLTQHVEKPRPQPLQMPLARPEPTATVDVSEAPTPLGSPKSKSKEFLNLFKMKRSPSPKSAKEPRKVVVTPTKTTFNDENVPITKTSPEKSPPRQRVSPQRPSLKSSSSKLKKEDRNRTLQDSVKVVPKERTAGSPVSSPSQSSFNGLAISDEQHRVQRESLARKLSESSQRSNKPNAPVQFTDSAFGFPLPPLSRSTVIMLDYRFPVHVERALYRLSHLKLANPRRPLRQQVLLSNFMYAYLNLVNHTLYLQQLDEEELS